MLPMQLTAISWIIRSRWSIRSGTRNSLPGGARRIGAALEAMQPDAVLCQGEMGMTCALVSLLWEKGVPVLHACSERIAQEQIAPDGRTIKVSEFVFRGFCAYVRP